MVSKSSRAVALLVLLSVLLGACVWNEPVATNQAAVWSDGGKLGACVEPGIYTDLNTFVDLIEVNKDTFPFEVSDPEVATVDNQLVGVTVSLQVRRNTDCESMKGMLTNFPALRENNQQIIDLLTPLVAEGMKNGVRAFNLDGLLSDRNGLSEAIRTSIEDDAKKYYIEVVGVQVKNVALNADYARLLQDKANLTVQRDTKIKERDIIQQNAANQQFEQEQLAITLGKQLEAEKAKTAVEVEVAKREGEKTAASQQVYSSNPQAFELEKLRLMAQILGKGTIYFIPEGTTLSTFLGGLTTPVVQPAPATP